ncbi:YggS family pyridoxal phosphate-dependent enzyme [Aureibacillus halotolerans]|uniref:Pyridoxal phosphate homeostasis protein n=1 Tax=Aureibacillus halotolerans TaxID=1508390 RepID=A0A4R6U738_9BACI|nr:YggS family pyridoxal phosphate-dependent enzyme [Aureibacillus halotolerans]TDQ42340.1 hypothetical protein EV213_102372 [Aureibacillus halotolerans]
MINTIQDNVASVQTRIHHAAERAGRSIEDVTLIAVTKYTTVDVAKALLQSDLADLGENRLEGLQEKSAVIGNGAKWHFIGSLQSRKVASLVGIIDMLHSLDRASLAKEINKRWESPLPCFVQVNVSGEQSKQGIDPDNVTSFIQELAVYENIQIVGLMTMAPLTKDENHLRHCFRSLRQLRDEVAKKAWSHAPCSYLSMGMSNDFEIAIEEGATHVRIGSLLTEGV